MQTFTTYFIQNYFHNFVCHGTIKYKHYFFGSSIQQAVEALS